jgi:hypothetical protein
MSNKSLLTDLSANLYIKMNKPFRETATVMDFAETGSKIESVELCVMGRHLDEYIEIDDMDESFFKEIGYNKPTIKVQSHASIEMGRVVKHTAPNGKCFTNEDLIKVVEETERQTRGDSEWFGGVDCHHVYFEGIHFDDDSDVGTICWGS